MSLIKKYTPGPGFLNNRISSPVGLLIMALIGFLIAYCTFKVNQNIPIFISVAMCGILFIVICFRFPELGYYAVLLTSSLIAMPGRFTGVYFPWGAVIEAMQYIVLFALISKQFRERQKTSGLWRNPVFLVVILQYMYTFVEVFNPDMGVLMGWSVTFRKILSYLLFMYMTYLVITDYQKLRRFMIFWLSLSLFIALYGIKQQWFGFFGFEDRAIRADPRGYELLFQGGFIRKMSILNDPPLFGVGMALMAIVSLILGFRSTHRLTSILLYASTFIFLVASSYSGTRTANVVFAAGMAAYIVFTLIEKRTFVLTGSLIFLIAFALFGPFNNSQVIWRIRTTFEGSKEASAVVRDVNRHAVQPYVWKHPIGGGIGTSGYEGALYNPNHYLAPYQPDGYLPKVLVEQGPVGLFFQLLIFGVLLMRGVNGYHRAKRPEIKTIYIMITAFFFGCLIGQISQTVPGSYPYIYMYFAFITLIIKLPDLENEEPEPLINTSL